MKRLFTFCGTGPYTETTYHWEGRSKRTALFPCALAEWLQPDRIHVGLTEQAAVHENWHRLQAELSTAEALRIPDGDAAGDEWILLEAMEDVCEPGDEVYFDITHSFRALPVVMLVAVFYLETVKQVRIGGIYYGAFQRAQPEHSSVRDLSGLVELMRWIQAVQQFQQTSDTRAFSGLLEAIQRRAHSDPEAMDKPRKLQRLARALRETGVAFAANQPLGLEQKARELIPKIEEAEAEVRDWAPPFALLLDQMRTKVVAWQRTDLAGLRQLARAYADLDQLMQAASLAREWCVNAVLHLQGESEILDREARMNAEKILNQTSLMRAGIFDPEKGGALLDESLAFDRHPLADPLIAIWDHIATRNALAHAGFQREPIPVSALQKNTHKMIETLEAFPLDQLVRGSLL